ncbi:protein translocase subunit secB [Hasllibacter halocynthiae]|uniref:Protein-export protein SecB n=1 Tax=Hasllibacter halocynthiae TaxID=595589 RepID=A0A2T0X2E8_9RHOB|nr:protein-export chaperone SecB [Hasllibacter halocynthiae]PRY93133.1 protein translocase subunit secB [Hasllibacter halocynthiae]
MAENENGAATGAGTDATTGGQGQGGQGGGEATQPQQAAPTMKVLGQFVRDLSFENILAQKGLKGEVQPDIRVQVALDAKKRQSENQYEVGMKLNVASRQRDGDATLFLLELDYVGLFQVEGVPENQLHPFLLIQCPQMLFPFVRRIVHDVTRDGGFPALNLEQIDFVGLYRNQILAQQQKKAAEQPAS